MPYSTNRQWLGIARETTRGTANPTMAQYFPIESPAWQPTITQVMEKGLQGDMNAEYGQVNTLRTDAIGWASNVRLDTIPALIRAALGSADTVTGTAAPYSHALTLLNTGQPPSYTIDYFDGFEVQQFVASQMETLDFEFTGDGILTVKPKFIANGSVVVTGASNGQLSSETSLPAYALVATLAGVPVTKVVSGSMSFARGTKPIPAATGTQNYYANFAGPLSTKGCKMTVVFESDTEFNYYLNNTNIPVDLKFVNPVTSEYIDFNFAVAGFNTSKKNEGKEWMEVDLEWWGEPNSTNGSATNLVPCVVTVNNAISTAY